AALFTSGKVESLKSGVELSRDVVNSGEAMNKVAELAEFTQRLDKNG
ncbi:MAG TPA: anthranilate phosphoribosyltransferase, partial [Dehalococcoidia bacterium]|nr:anthranilate phosphoribosyltransferase [Dehalococcoidia bacterium]